MILCNYTTVSPATLVSLGVLQSYVNNEPNFQSRVNKAKKEFKQQNKERNPTFAVVRAVMMIASHAGHCAYCEVDTGAEIDHFRPTSLYPGETFQLDNYVRCCSICNKKKGERFPTFNDANSSATTIHKIGRAKRLPPISSSPPGDPAALSPRNASLLDYVELDLGSFLFSITAAPGSREYALADETIKLLGLNARERLRKKRQWAYEQYFRLLRAYVRDLGTMSARMKRKAAGEARSIHCRSVWEEMKRQRQTHADLRPLFAATADPLSW